MVKTEITNEEQALRDKEILLVILNECYECGKPCISFNGSKKCLCCDSEYVGGELNGRE